MKAVTRGIHHVTAIATDPQRNVDFFTGVLGLRFVKKTVNFDDPGSYHLYFGDEVGGPGTIMTFFAWPKGPRGSRGAGQATVTSFSIPAESLDFWAGRLDAFGVVREPVSRRFGADSFVFYDPDGLKLELVADAEAAVRGAWKAGPVAEGRAIRGFHSVTLAVRRPEKTRRILTDLMGFRVEGEQDARVRLVAGAPTDPGRRVELLHAPDEPPGHVAAGTVHHVAFRADDDAAELEMREALARSGQRVTDVRDRSYFRSIYFREPGGVLFEIATDEPGFTVDEPVEDLGASLRLPSWLEQRRARIEGTLPPVEVRTAAGQPEPAAGQPEPTAG